YKYFPHKTPLFLNKKRLFRQPRFLLIMNGYDVIISNIEKWATANTQIRAAIIIGSRARRKEPADKWSDLDIIIITHDISEYSMTDDWIKTFGIPLVIFKETAFDGSLEKRILYDDFHDVDFVLMNEEGFKSTLQLEEVKTIFHHDYTVLVDKDNIQKYIGKTQEKMHTGITDEMIMNEIQDYLYHCVWIVKKVKRGELWTALNCLNCYMKNKLLCLIELYTQSLSGKEKYTWYNGRMLERWAPASLLTKLKGCFADYDTQILKDALLHQMEIHHELAETIAKIRNIPYPVQQRKAILQWIGEIL
ncbi:MAG: aminoglycoside 6-adenylyltransferase, partial [Spirochaetales bacterium]|nr:aminoglycoside 6-adenylyltransferase [Spirochaetales bacterium]